MYGKGVDYCNIVYARRDRRNLNYSTAVDRHSKHCHWINIQIEDGLWRHSVEVDAFAAP